MARRKRCTASISAGRRRPPSPSSSATPGTRPWVWPHGVDEPGDAGEGQVKRKDMSGPVGIVDLMAETGEQAASARDAVYDLLYLGAFIAVNLAIMNMLPIPTADGGGCFSCWCPGSSSLTRRHLDPKYEGGLCARRRAWCCCWALLALVHVQRYHQDRNGV